MRVNLYLIALFVFVLVGCNTVEEKEVQLPDVEKISFDNINTDLPRINIETKNHDWDTMMRFPHSKIFIDATFSYSGYGDVSDLPVQLRVKGAGSVDYTLKSLEVIFQTPLDNDRFKIFSNHKLAQQINLSQLKNLRLRNSGQDFTKTMVKDKALTLLAENSKLDFLTMKVGEPTHVFVNNNYYGLLNIRTESNLNSIAKQSEVSVDEVVVYKVDVDNGNIEYNEGNYLLTTDLEAAIDRGDPREMSDLVSETSLIDYIVFQDYIGNTDWPHNNIRMYSVNEEPFRFVLYDLDHASEKTKNPLLPELEYVSHDLGKMYRAFRKIEGFDARLKTRQKELYKVLTPQIFYELVDQQTEKIRMDIQYQIAEHGFPISVYKWNWEVDKMKRDFEMRDYYIRDKYKIK